MIEDSSCRYITFPVSALFSRHEIFIRWKHAGKVL